MEKELILRDMDYMIFIIKNNPELFHDGINEEILELLFKIKKYIKEEK